MLGKENLLLKRLVSSYNVLLVRVLKFYRLLCVAAAYLRRIRLKARYSVPIALLREPAGLLH